METKQNVRCPACSHQFVVSSKSGKTEVTIKCPSCQTQLKVKLSVAGNSSGIKNKTLTPGDIYKYKVGNLILKNSTIALKIGRNTIGRESNEADVTIRLSSDDQYLSRRHAIIDVIRLANGMVDTVLYNWQNTNPTYVNGQLVMEGDKISLNHGDTIQMGKTAMRFVVPSILE